MKYTNTKQIPMKPLIHRDFLNLYSVNGPTLHAVYYMGYSTYSTFMMHEPSTLVGGKFSDIENVVNFNKRFSNKIIKELVNRHSKMSSSEYTRLSKSDYYMLPEDALKHGFIDTIVTDVESIF